MSADAVPVLAAALPLQPSPFRDQARQRAAAFDNLAEGILLSGKGSKTSFSQSLAEVAALKRVPMAHTCAVGLLRVRPLYRRTHL